MLSLIRKIPGLAVIAGAAQIVSFLACKSQKCWRRNFRNTDVNLSGGIGLSLGLLMNNASLRGETNQSSLRQVLTASQIATLSAAISGGIDDFAESTENSRKGLKGHFGALREGVITTGLLKVVGIGTGSAIAAAVLPSNSDRMGGKLADWMINTGIIAGCANVHNLLDLRPGRVLKFSTPLQLLGTFSQNWPLSIVNYLGIATSFPTELSEKTMLGDTGANALGAATGVLLAARPNRVLRGFELAIIVFLTLLSEKVSFSKIIETNSVLSRVDRLGRAS